MKIFFKGNFEKNGLKEKKVLFFKNFFPEKAE